MKLATDMLRHHAVCTSCTCSALLISVFLGPFGTMGLLFSGIASAMLVVANPLMGFRSATTPATRLAFALLEVVNVGLLGVCLMPLIIKM